MNDTTDPGALRESFNDEVPEAPFKRLTREEAALVKADNPSLSPWRVVAAQTVAGLVCSAIVWGFTQRGAAAWSTLYGAAVVVVPSALLARGMARSVSTTRGVSPNPGALMFGFMLWEAIKIALAVAMLVAAAKVVPGLSWPALLVAMVVCIKVNWLALLWRRPPVVIQNQQQRV